MKNYRSLLSKAIVVGSAGAGAAIGSLAGFDGVGAVAGIAAIVGEACKSTLDELANRALSPREEIRVASVANQAIDSIRERLLFETPREDDFFTTEAANPSPAAELFEGVLLSAKGEHEELKLRYLANLFSNILFEANVSRSEANHLLTIADALTYEQLRLISLIGQSNKFHLRADAWTDYKTISIQSRNLAQQMLYLYQRQIILSYDEDGEVSGGIYDVDLVTPNLAGLSHIGKRLNKLLGLNQIPADELRILAGQL